MKDKICVRILTWLGYSGEWHGEIIICKESEVLGQEEWWGWDNKILRIKVTRSRYNIFKQSVDMVRGWPENKPEVFLKIRDVDDRIRLLAMYLLESKDSPIEIRSKDFADIYIFNDWLVTISSVEERWDSMKND